MDIIFKDIFVRQDHLTMNSVLWYLNNKNSIPIALVPIPGEKTYLILDGHNQLAADLLGKKEPLIKIVQGRDDIINTKDFPREYKEAVDERNLIIQDRYSIALDFGHQKKEKTILGLMNYLEKGHVNSFLDNLFMFQNDYVRAGHDFFKQNNIRSDIKKFYFKK